MQESVLMVEYPFKVICCSLDIITLNEYVSLTAFSLLHEISHHEHVMYIFVSCCHKLLYKSAWSVYNILDSIDAVQMQDDEFLPRLTLYVVYLKKKTIYNWSLTAVCLLVPADSWAFSFSVCCWICCVFPWLLVCFYVY